MKINLLKYKNNALVKYTTLNLFGLIIIRISGLIASIFLAKYFGPELYGSYSIYQNTVAASAIFTGAGLGITATKYVAQNKINNPILAGKTIYVCNKTGFYTGIIGAILLAGTSNWLANNILKNETLVLPLLLGSASLLIGTIVGVQNGILIGFEAHKEAMKIAATTAILNIPLTIFFALIWKIEGCIAATIITTSISAIFNKKIIKEKSLTFGIKIENKIKYNDAKILIQYSLPSFLSNAMVIPTLWITNAMLANSANGYKELGLINIANQWKSAALMLPAAISTSLLPYLSSQISNTGYKKSVEASLIINIAIGIAIGGSLALASPLIIKIYGSEYKDAITPLLILSAVVTITSINNVAGQILASKDKMWIGFSFNTLWALIIVITSYYLIKLNYGATALAAATLTASTALAAAQGIYIKKTLNIKK